ncbi:WYL domain-containing protein [Maridesulfovibrio hydrothermalis]|nr:WYL domain-containing protein [Maridesulfovibrio hydrothermalis]
MADYLDISLERASAAIKEYVKLAPNNAHYDPSAKVYKPTINFKPLIINPSPDQVLGHLLLEDGFLSPMPEMMRLPVPHRAIPTDILRVLLSTMAENQSIDILYRSMTSPKPTRRRITPHAFGNDGFRWHVRAYCSLREQFRDFVLGRIVETGERGPSKSEGLVDEKWDEIVFVRIGPHPELSENHKIAIEMDYDMEDGETVFEVRRAMLFYVLKQLGLHRTEEERKKMGIKPKEQQIVLINTGLLELIEF